MSYVGPNPVTQSFVAGTDYFTGNGVTRLFSLSRQVGSSDDLLVSVNNEELDPTQYTITGGNQLTFSTAPAAPTAPFIANNIVVRYMTTVLWQLASSGGSGGGVSNYYQLGDVTSTYAYTLLSVTGVSAIPSATTLTLTTVAGLSVGSIISATILVFSGQVITNITGLTVTVASTAQWGVAGNPPTITALYLWNTPSNYSTAVYSTTTQKWVNSYAQFVSNSQNLGIGYQTLGSAALLGGSIGNTAFGHNTGAALTTGDNHLLLGNSAGSALTTSNRNLIIGGFTGNSPALNISAAGNFGYPAVIAIFVSAGTTASGGVSTLTFTFGSVATAFLPATLTTASIPASSNLATVLAAIATALNADPIVSANWTVSTSPTNVVLVQIAPAIVGLPLAFTSTWSVAPSTGLLASFIQNDAIIYSNDGNIVISDQAANIRAICTANGYWGFNTPRPLANVHVEGWARLQQAFEKTEISAIPLSGTLDYGIGNQALTYYTAEATGDWVWNFTGTSGASVSTLNAILPIGHSVTVALFTTQGAIPYYCTGIQIDGVAPAYIRWQGATAPTAGNALGNDLYVFTITKTALATFSVFASLTRYGGM